MYRLAILEGRVTETRAQVDYHDTMLLRGNGKPGLTVRMEVQENFMSDVRKFLMWTAGTSVATFLTVLGWMLAELIGKH